MYWTWYSDDASSSFANALNANFVVPEGLDINDVDISCVISDERQPLSMVSSQQNLL